MSSKQIVYALGLLAIITQSIVAGVTYLGAWTTAGDRSEETLRLIAESTAKNVQHSLTFIDHALAGSAEVLPSANFIGPDNVASTEQRLKLIFPSALLIRVIPEGTNALDESRTPKMGFADLEMVKQTAATTPLPAAHAAGTPDAHIAAARAIPGKRATILASLSINLLREALPNLPAGAALDIRQENLSLAFQGDNTLKEASPSGIIPIPNSSWQIAYWTPPSHWPMSWLVLAAPLLVTALTGAAFVFAAKWHTRATQADQTDILRLVEDLVSGRRPDIYTLRLLDYDILARGVARLRDIARITLSESPKPKIESPSDTAETQQISTPAESKAIAKIIPTSIFRAYDIRGIVGDTLTSDIAHDLGKAIGSEAHTKGDQRVFVARDGRKSSPELSAALIKGLQSTGRTVVDLGLVPTPVLYFATCVLNGKSGVIVTGSHNPANYNGFKVVIGGETLAEEGIQQLRRRVESQDFIAGIGRIENRDISSEYIDRILEDMQLGRHMKIVVDAGNGAAGKIAPTLLKSMGCDVHELYCEIDGEFPNHHPDPSKPENLAMLIKTVIEEEADLGVAFDGDGDRLGVVDAKGKIIWPDRQMMVFAADVLSRQPGADIIYDVKCSRHLASQVVKNGGRPMMWKTGHSLIKSKMRQTGAMLAGEMSGHIFFKERWFGFDDGIYASARLIEILSGDPRSTDEVFEELPDSVNTPELNVALSEGKSATFVEKLKELAQFPEARIIDIDGLRVDFVDGWGLVRASNTTPSLVIRFEADNEAALSRIQDIFRRLLLQIDPQLTLPF